MQNIFQDHADATLGKWKKVFQNFRKKVLYKKLKSSSELFYRYFYKITYIFLSFQL